MSGIDGQIHDVFTHGPAPTTIIRMPYSSS